MDARVLSPLSNSERDKNNGTQKEALEFDVEDAVLLMEPGIDFDRVSTVQHATKAPKTKPVAKQHKFIDYNRALDATQLYLNEIGFSPLLTPEEEVHFARLARKGDPAGRKRMIESNLRLVVKIARRYVNRGLSLLDLVEEGNLGLIRAVEKFDPERGSAFRPTPPGGFARPSSARS